MQTQTTQPRTEVPVETPAIVMRHVRKQYGQFEALRDMSLTVPVGTIHGLLGPNGAGKSTLIKTLVGVSRPTSGEIRILDLDPVRQSHALRPRIGYMPQLPALYDDLPARVNVRFFARAFDLPDLERRVDEALEFVALSDRRHDPVYAFSGGMKQRVSLACALVHNPSVLFLDEPTAGVDPKLKEAFWQHFRDLARRGVTLFISTHLMDEALLCDTLTVIRTGAVLVSAAPRDIMQKGNTRVRIYRGNHVEEVSVSAYYTELPRVLQPYGLQRDIQRIELHEDSLESIVVQMIQEAEG